jgi:hypothetical protein
MATKKQKRQAAATGTGATTKPKPKKKTTRGKSHSDLPALGQPAYQPGDVDSTHARSLRIRRYSGANTQAAATLVG